ncbi:DUF2334 domain-containing protein [Mariniflexile aquimaris]|uniref:DUF2334 domain-containing protein n=1 Tax=Mariniflexile aquimaris TaxID=881009 RepID=A0ABW3BUL9_9FLAO
MITKYLYKKIKRIALSVCVLTFLFACNNTEDTTEKNINIVFRFDDFNATSNTQLEQKIINVFKDNKCSFTIAAIPYVADGDVHDSNIKNVIPMTEIKGDILKKGIKEGVIDLALHGYSHQVNLKPLNEFAGLDYNIQLEKLTKAKALLEGLVKDSVTTFVPPWNSYDFNTIKALETLGFTLISAKSDRPGLKTSQLKFVPYTCELPQLEEAIKKARKNYDSQPTIIVMFHAYDFIESNKSGNVSVKSFQKLISSLKKQKDISIFSLEELSHKNIDLSATKYQTTNKIFLFNEFMPSFLKNDILVNYNNKKYELLKLILTVISYYVIILTMCSILSFFIMRSIGILVKKFLKAGLIISIIIPVVLVIYFCFFDSIVSKRDLLLSSIIIGFSTGFLIYIKKSDHVLKDKKLKNYL